MTPLGYSALTVSAPAHSSSSSSHPPGMAYTQHNADTDQPNADTPIEAACPARGKMAGEKKEELAIS